MSIEIAPSTAFHPQTDGQVERTNAILEDYLRHFVSEKQDDWSKWISLAELSFNNSASSSTGFSPFFANFGFHPRFDLVIQVSRVPHADSFVQMLHDIQGSLIIQLEDAKKRQAKFYNADRIVDVVYLPGDLVWLSRRYIKSRRPSPKLDYRRIGPFHVVRMVGKNAVELQLSAEFSRIHPVFNVSLITPFHQDSTSEVQKEIVLPSDADAIKCLTNWVAISHILGHQIVDNEHFYLLRGVGSVSDEDDVWTDLKDISSDLDPFIEQYHQIHLEDIRPPSFEIKSLNRMHFGFSAKKF